MKFSKYIKPMLAKSGGQPFDSEDWLFEIKLDGYRAIAEVNNDKVRLYSRNGLDFSNHYPTVFEALKKLKTDAIFDGEIVALDNNNHTSFQQLQHVSDDPTIAVYYYIFDLLEYNGDDIRNLPLIERKKILQKLLKKNNQIRYSDHIEKDGKDFFKLIKKQNLEGMIAKRSNSTYQSEKRNGDWLKVKYHHEQEAVIAGFTAPKGSRKFFGALLLAVYEKGKLKYAGNVGSGFDDKTLKELHEKMKPLIIEESPFSQKIPGLTSITWIKPKLVANIKFTEWTENESMRHPVFLGLRIDKNAKEVIKEK